MKKSFKFLSLLMSLLMIMSAISVPAFADGAEQTAQYPNTDSFFWGVDAHLGHQSYPVSDIEKQVELAAKLGAKVYSIDVPGIANITDADKLVRAANAWGMDVLLSLGGESSTPEEITVFYGLVAKHYASGDFGRVKYLKILNETDNKCIAEDGDGTTADSYDTEKVAAMAARIKAANDAIKAVSQDFVTVVNYSWLHECYLDLVRAQGADWDVTGINWYTNMQEHPYANDGLRTALSNLQKYDTLKNKKVIVTESNTWGGSDTLSDGLKDIMSAAYESDMVIGMCFYELLDEPGNSEGEQNFGLVRYTAENGIGEVKPVYTTIQGLIGGSDNITRGTFTPSANYPTGNTTYNKVKSYDGVLTTGSENGGLDFGETVDLFNYEAVEMDIYVNSLGTDPVSFNYRMHSPVEGAVRIAGNEDKIPVNQWVHKLVYIDSFVNYGASGRDMVKFVIDNLPENTIVNITNLTFVDGISPEMNNTYYTAKELDYKLFINGTTNSAYAKKTIGEVVDITKYDYLEFDTYYTGDADSANCNLLAIDTNNNFKRGGATFTKDTWVHCVVATSSFGWDVGDMTKVNAFQPEVLNGGTYIITNMALTTEKPVAKYEHSVALELNADHSTSKGYCTWKEFGTGTTDFTKYNYLEFDFYAANATDNHKLRMVIECDNIKNEQGAKGQAFYDFEPVANTFVHYVIPISELDTGWGYNGDKTKCVKYNIDYGFMEDGASYKFYNLALTTENPVAKYEHYLGAELVSSFSNSKGWCVPANFATGVTDFTKYGYVEFDFKATNATDGAKTRIMFKNEGGYGFYDITPASDEWIHYVVPVNDIDCGWGFGGDRTIFNSVVLEYGFMEDGASYKIANMALTSDKPVAKYEHYLGLDLNADHGISKGWCTSKEFGTGTTDFTKYDYLEFDFYAKNATGNNWVRMVIQCESGQAYYDVEFTANTLTHFVVPIADLLTGYDYNGDKTKCISYIVDYNTMEDGASYSFYNLALTTEEEIKPETKGDANEDGKINILDLIHMKKMSAELIDPNENADINGDGIVDAEDITLLRQYLLGIISSFDDIA